ncbi:MAG: membrane protein FxsA [Hyphomicrobiales bacterium]|nr:membrane protein FxsA [Hyphomicrobiales bacterium]
MLKFLPFLLIVVPLMEIAAFVAIGGQIGVAATLALIVVTALIGSILLRIQGFGILARIQSEIAQDRLPGVELGHGAMILVAGVLLLTPGFITDALGFLLFVPAVRSAIWHAIRSRLDVVVMGHGAPFQDAPYRSPTGNGPVVDLDEDDYTRTDDGGTPDPNSPWRNGDNPRLR